jgi:hypothetical protein
MSRIVISRRSLLKTATLLCLAAAGASCSHAPAPQQTAVPTAMPTVDGLEKTLVPGMSYHDADQALQSWKMDRMVILPDKSKLASAKPPLPPGTVIILYGERTDVSNGRKVVVFVYLDSGYKILKTVAGETKKPG